MEENADQTMYKWQGNFRPYNITEHTIQARHWLLDYQPYSFALLSIDHNLSLGVVWCSVT